MLKYLLISILSLSLSGLIQLMAQDNESPLPPILDLVSVEPGTGNVIIEWTAGGSPDVAGYVIYLYEDNEGYAIDTIYDPDARSYLNNKSNASFFSESYVIAAIDSADNISPLSNFLNTIYLQAKLDTCANRIELIWNSYVGQDPELSQYIVYSSRDGEEYIIDGQTEGSDTSYLDYSFESYSEYCYYIEAVLENDRVSSSNIFCLETDLPIAPAWINADYATVNEDGHTGLSFTIDPLTEYTRYRFERSEDSITGFTGLTEITTADHNIVFVDEDTRDNIFYYRLAALNSCNEPVVYSNPASVLKLSLISDSEKVLISWNKYYRWRGDVNNYILLRNNRGIFEEIAWLNGSDSVYSDYLIDLIYLTEQENICYKLIAEEGNNPFVETALSISDTICTSQPVKIFVPNTFTPDDNLLNDFFKPVLSFTPIRYRMIIKDRSGTTLFETEDPLEAWNGKYRNSKLPEDIYIWFIELQTPAGKTIKRTGTVAVIFNRHP